MEDFDKENKLAELSILSNKELVDVVDDELLLKAAAGSLTAIQIWKKTTDENKFEAIKKEIFDL